MPVQKDIISTVVRIYGTNGNALKSSELAKVLERSEGTIRNQMQNIRALGLVESRTGPYGGYIPTSLAYEVLNFDKSKMNIPVYKNEEKTGILLNQLTITSSNMAKLHILGDTHNFEIGDEIKIASENLIFCGRMIGCDSSNNTLLTSIDVAYMASTN
ncbi:MAG TPA: HTH domain-containing protein [Methanosarcinaceae archaeon]|nr:HTH domain-containing protein [Methanosarcinaceae archaeon]